MGNNDDTPDCLELDLSTPFKKLNQLNAKDALEIPFHM